MAVQLERRVSVDLLVVVQSGVWLFAANRTAADRPVRRNRADLPVPGYRTAGLVRRECTLYNVTTSLIDQWRISIGFSMG